MSYKGVFYGILIISDFEKKNRNIPVHYFLDYHMVDRRAMMFNEETLMISDMIVKIRALVSNRF